MSDALERARGVAEWDASQEVATSHSPDARTVPFLLSGILDALIAIAERLPDTTVISPELQQPSDS